MARSVEDYSQLPSSADVGEASAHSPWAVGSAVFGTPKIIKPVRSWHGEIRRRGRIGARIFSFTPNSWIGFANLLDGCVRSRRRFGDVAQSAERRFCKSQVPSSILGVAFDEHDYGDAIARFGLPSVPFGANPSRSGSDCILGSGRCPVGTTHKRTGRQWPEKLVSERVYLIKVSTGFHKSRPDRFGPVYRGVAQSVERWFWEPEVRRFETCRSESFLSPLQ